MNKKNTKIIIILGLICLFLSVPVFAQRGSRVLMCNERKSVSDRLKFPRQAKIVKAASGTKSYLEWRGFIGNDKGNYDLRISSYSNFSYEVWKKSKSRNGRWQRVAGGRSAIRDTSSGRNFYKFERLFTSPGFFSNGVDILIRVKPYKKPVDVRFSWYTTKCDKTEPTGCRIENIGGGLFGIERQCICNRRVVPMSRCRGGSRRFTSLNLMELPKNQNKVLKWTQQKQNHFAFENKMSNFFFRTE